jgi:hypothetical protein
MRNAAPWALLLSPLIALAQQAAPQPDTAAADSELPKLELKQAPDAGDGKLAAIEGEADQEGLRIALPDLSVLQPVEVRLATGDPSRPLHLEITKFGYDGVLKSATTDADGLAVLRFRTQMGVNLGIKAVDAEAPFQLVAWVGDELEAVPQNVFKPMSAKQEEKARWWPLAIALVAIGALAGLAFVFLKRRKHS